MANLAEVYQPLQILLKVYGELGKCRSLTLEAYRLTRSFARV